MSKKEKTKLCKHCKAEIPNDVKVCPNCNKKQGGGVLKWILICVLAIVVIGLIGGGSEKDSNPVSSENVSNNDSQEISTTGEVNTTEEVVTTESVEETSEPATEQSDAIPTEYKSALKSAESYSKTMHMSKKGIYDQLTSEYGDQFSPEAAQYAIDNMTSDWNNNALETAKSYGNKMHMSKKAIYNQLISENGEQFTPEEAQYAVDNLQIDYNNNALESAKEYQESMNMSPEEIRDQLTSEYGDQFTQEEADYAVSNLK